MDMVCGMEITIIGAGTLVPSLNRQAAGIVIKIGEKYLLFDSGSGVFYKLLSAGIDYKKIDDFFYSHFEHPDHINDLPFFIFANMHDNIERQAPLNITGPPGISGFYDNLLRLYPALNDPHFEVNLKEISAGTIDFDNFSVSAKPMTHRSAASVAYRIDADGKSMVYTGDTDYNTGIVELAGGADLLISECSLPDELKAEGHLTPGLAGRIASEARVKKLVLTHIYPICESFDIQKQARAAFDGEIVIARDFMKIILI